MTDFRRIVDTVRPQLRERSPTIPDRHIRHATVPALQPQGTEGGGWALTASTT